MKLVYNTPLFVTGIDTGVGKSIATGLMAGFLRRKRVDTITQKMVQTGCVGISEDILIHRKLMGIDLLKEDRENLTCPYLFRHPASPHLAADMEGKTIDPNRISQCTNALKKRFDAVFLEGAGGLLVPLNREITILDYIEKYQLPVVLVTSSRLGSINHTLLSLMALKQRNLSIKGVIYNMYPESDHFISADSVKIIAEYMKRFEYSAKIIKLGRVDMEAPPQIDFSSFFK